MAGTLKRPILIGGISLSFALWLLESLDRSVGEFGEWGVLGLIAVGAGAWWFKQRSPEPLPEIVPETIARSDAERVLEKAKTLLDRLSEESETPCDDLQQRWTQLHDNLDRTDIKLAIVGSKSVGKTALAKVLRQQWLQNNDRVEIDEVPAFFRHDEADNLQDALTADLVVFLIDGDLTDSERQVLQHLRQQRQTVLLAWNKGDRYDRPERDAVLARVRSNVTNLLDEDCVCTVAAAPDAIEVRRHQTDNTVVSRRETPEPEISDLTRILDRQLANRSPLVWGTVYRQARRFKNDVKTRLNAVRRDRALPIITQYQWVAAATAFANPVPALDLLATGAISAQLVLDLGNLYQQRLSLQQAQAAAGTLGSLMVKLGLVELSTQLVSTALKHNPVTFVAGGTVQGLSAAYLTRIAGLSLVEYFEQQDVENPATSVDGERLGSILQNVFNNNQRMTFVKSLVRQGIDRFSAKSPEDVVMG